MNNFDLVIFDLDGTLVQSSLELGDALNDTLRELGLTPVQQAQVDAWIGHGTRDLLTQTLAFALNCTPAQAAASTTFAQAMPRFDAHYIARCGTRSALYPRVRETLQGLRARGIKLALLTNKEASLTAALLAAHQLSDAFDLLICGDTLPTRKPDPVGVAYCLARFGVAAQRALLVGDSSIDVATARNAGVPVWAVPYGYNRGQPIEACAPDRVIADCAALLAA